MVREKEEEDEDEFLHANHNFIISLKDIYFLSCSFVPLNSSPIASVSSKTLTNGCCASRAKE